MNSAIVGQMCTLVVLNNLINVCFMKHVSVSYYARYSGFLLNPCYGHRRNVRRQSKNGLWNSVEKTHFVAY